MSLGRLIQPFVSVTWGDLTLSSWDYGDKMKRPVVFNVSVDLKAGNDQVNKASIEFDPSPIGYRAYTQCISEDYIQKPIKIKIGYDKGTVIETVFFCQNVDFTTGKSQQIVVHLAGKHKTLLTSHWWNEYINDGVKEMPVKEIFSHVIKKAGMTSKFTPEADKVLADLPKVTKAVLTNQTAGGFLVASAKKYGLILEYPTGSEEDNKTIVVSTPATNKEQLTVEEQSKLTGKLDVGSQRAGKRLGFIIGPTLVAEIKRSTKPYASTQKDADTSYQISVSDTPEKAGAINVIENQATEQAKQRPSGSTTLGEKTNITQCEGLKDDALKKCRAKIEKNTKKKAENEYSQCSTQMMMVPYMVGIKPYDFVVFPSLKGDFIEDWEVDSVSYKQEGGTVVISVNGKRPQVGKGNLMDEGTLNKFKEKVKSLTTLLSWHRYYWNIK
jgi:hypothetical protein